ncbi:hypothetical protein AB0N67_08465 [Streptomyces microflavus]
MVSPVSSYSRSASAVTCAPCGVTYFFVSLVRVRGWLPSALPYA